MDFNLTDDQRAIEDAARAFAAAELAPHSARWDEEKHFPVDVLRKAAELGFAGLYVGEDVGGSALSRLDASIVFEQLSYGDVSTAAFISIHNMASWMIDRFGSDELRRRYLPRLTTMELIASYCLTEPGSGSDAAAMTTTARKDGDAYVLNGSKAFISGAGTSDIYVVMARTGGPGAKGVSAFVVELGTPGLSFGAQEKKMGWNSQPTAQVNFDDCRVPEANRIGQEGEGFRFAMAGLDGGRINIASCSLGGAGLALDLARDYLTTRKQFGMTLNRFQALTFRAADMYTSLELTRSIVSWASMVLADRSSTPAQVTEAARRAKLQVSTAGRHVGQEAIQLHGGIGMTMEYAVGHMTARLTAIDHLLGDGREQTKHLAETLTDHGVVEPLP